MAGRANLRASPGHSRTRQGWWAVIWLKACRRCGGDLFLERELEGDAIRCLQCGATLTLAQQHAAGLRPPRRPTARPISTSPAPPRRATRR